MEYHGPQTGEFLIGGVFLAVAVLVWLAFMVLAAVIWWKIFAKAGYSGALGLLMLVPVANLVMLLVLAFGTWPVHRELEHLKQFHGAR